MRAEYQRWMIANTASPIAASTTMMAKIVSCPRSRFGIDWSMMRRNANGATSDNNADKTMVSTKPLMLARYGRAKTHTRRNAPFFSRAPFTASASFWNIMWGPIRIAAKATPAT